VFASLYREPAAAECRNTSCKRKESPENNVSLVNKWKCVAKKDKD